MGRFEWKKKEDRNVTIIIILKTHSTQKGLPTC